MGQRNTCAQHKEENKLCCLSCNQFICEKCIDSHKSHNIKHIESVCFDLSSNFSQSVSNIDAIIHSEIQNSQFPDVKSVFSMCYNSLNYIISEVRSFEESLKSFQCALMVLIEKCHSERDELLKKENLLKIQLFEINKEISEVTSKKNFKLMTQAIVKGNDFLGKLKSNISSDTPSKHQSSIMQFIENSKSSLKEISENLTSFGKEIGTELKEKINNKLSSLNDILIKHELKPEIPFKSETKIERERKSTSSYFKRN